MYRRSLPRHVKRNYTDHPVFDCSQCGRSLARPDNLEKHKINCTGGAPAAKRQCVPVAVPVSTTTTASEFVLRDTRRSLGGVVK